MDKTVIITFIKKYTALLIPAGIMLFGVILLVPTLMIGGSIKEKVQSSAKQGQQVKRSLSNAHSQKDVDNMTAYQDQLDMDAKKVARLAKQSTQRELISYDVFPEPADSSTQIYTDFGVKLRNRIEAILKSANARSAPTHVEIRQELERMGKVQNHSGMEGVGSYGPDYGGAYGNRRDQGNSAKVIEKKLRDGFLKQRAQQMAVYATANVFDWYKFWKDWKFENRESALEDCWYSQLAFWVYEDVVDTVKSINSNSDSVFKSAVKRIIGVNFRRPANYLPETGRYGSMGDYGGMLGGGYGRRGTSNTKSDAPEYVTAAGAPGVFGFPTWTTRVCDDKIDVIHFSVAVVIRADSVFPFIKELCSYKEHTFKGYLPGKKQAPATYKHNQITVLQYWQEPVNNPDWEESIRRTASEHQRYRYGDDAVVKLNLTCEYIFTRSGYDQIKPDTIVKMLEEKTGSGSGAGSVPGAMPGGNPYGGYQ